MATNCDLVAIRTALLAPFAEVGPGLGASLITYQATPQGKPWAAGSAVVRAVVGLPARQTIGGAVDPIVQQDGLLTLQWLFPRSTGLTPMTTALEGTAAIYRQQTLAGGVELTGDARTTRVGVENDRIRWDVVVPWRTVNTESARADATPLAGSLPTTAQALATVRNVWLTRIEQAVPADSWAGLRTFYDDEPTWATPPALPFAGYWLAETASAARDNQGGTEQVTGRVFVQLHTDQSLGEAGPLATVERIVAQHLGTARGVRFGPTLTAGKQITRAGTYQTNLRIPFAFDRLRAS